MNTAEQLARFDAWFATHPVAPVARTYDPRAYLDPETLRLMHRPALSSSQSYRRAVDMPREPWMDELAVAVGDYREEWSA